ncbi:MAG: DUF368 domain-containing protein [Prevotellaceae bacterium]|jgi:putative membrane protein|nr:DUF368 domain-containing protein [Prevotellaceae bacterium]
MKHRKPKDYTLIALKGAGMGAADVVPGVSGGTIAFITGIYNELLLSIRNLPAAFKSLVSSKFNLKLFWNKLNGNFLLALILGIGLSFLSLAKLMSYLLTNFPVPTWSFFFGLILASVWLILNDIEKWTVGILVSLIAGTLAGYAITIVSPAQTPDALWFIFLVGTIAICAMILPGISGGFILLILGKYQFMLNAINELKIVIVLVFLCGAVSGLISFSYILSWLLNKFHFVTIAFLGGIMLGSLNKIWPWKQTVEFTTNSHGEQIPLLEHNVLPSTYSATSGEPSAVVLAIIMAIAGFAIIFIINQIETKYRNKQQKNK